MSAMIFNATAHRVARILAIAGAVVALSAPSSAATASTLAATVSPTPATPSPTTASAPPGATTPAPSPTPPASVPSGSITKSGGMVTVSSAPPTGHATGHEGLSAGEIAIAGVAALLILGCAAWAIARRRALEPRAILSLRHAIAEAGLRASTTWAEFTDWLRLGH
jgi:hypothetical protein